jgi:hypothetical protein
MQMGKNLRWFLLPRKTRSSNFRFLLTALSCVV